MELFPHGHQTHERRVPRIKAAIGFPTIPVSRKWKCPILHFENWLPFKGKHMVNELSFCARKFLRNCDAQKNGAKINIKE